MLQRQRRSSSSSVRDCDGSDASSGGPSRIGSGRSCCAASGWITCCSLAVAALVALVAVDIAFTGIQDVLLQARYQRKLGQADDRVEQQQVLWAAAHSPAPADPIISLCPGSPSSSSSREGRDKENTKTHGLTYVVTLTSLPHRYETLPEVLLHLLAQEPVAPQLVLLHVASFPESLKCFSHPRVGIRLVPDVGPITKVYYTIQDQRNASAQALIPSREGGSCLLFSKRSLAVS